MLGGTGRGGGEGEGETFSGVRRKGQASKGGQIVLKLGSLLCKVHPEVGIGHACQARQPTAPQHILRMQGSTSAGYPPGWLQKSCECCPDPYDLQAALVSLTSMMLGSPLSRIQIHTDCTQHLLDHGPSDKSVRHSGC